MADIDYCHFGFELLRKTIESLQTAQHVVEVEAGRRSVVLHSDAIEGLSSTLVQSILSLDFVRTRLAEAGIQSILHLRRELLQSFRSSIGQLELVLYVAYFPIFPTFVVLRRILSYNDLLILFVKPLNVLVENALLLSVGMVVPVLDDVGRLLLLSFLYFWFGFFIVDANTLLILLLSALAASQLHQLLPVFVGLSLLVCRTGLVYLWFIIAE